MTQSAPNGGRTCSPVINGFAESAATAFSTLTLCADTSPKRTTRRCRRVSMNTGKVPSGSANTRGKKQHRSELSFRGVHSEDRPDRNRPIAIRDHGCLEVADLEAIEAIAV